MITALTTIGYYGFATIAVAWFVKWAVQKCAGSARRASEQVSNISSEAVGGASKMASRAIDTIKSKAPGPVIIHDILEAPGDYLTTEEKTFLEKARSLADIFKEVPDGPSDCQFTETLYENCMLYNTNLNFRMKISKGIDELAECYSKALHSCPKTRNPIKCLLTDSTSVPEALKKRFRSVLDKVYSATNVMVYSGFIDRLEIEKTKQTKTATQPKKQFPQDNRELLYQVEEDFLQKICNLSRDHTLNCKLHRPGYVIL